MRKRPIRRRDLAALRDTYLALANGKMLSKQARQVTALHAADLDFLIRGGRL